MTEQQYVGFHETAALLGLSRSALGWRTDQTDFPQPVFVLAATPVWTKTQIIEYAKARHAAFYERPGVRRLAEEDE